MNTKNNRRSQNTQKRIRQVLLQLLQDHALEDLNISGLCREAKINRTTFYTYYTDLHDLLNKIEDDMATRFLDIARQKKDEGLTDREAYLLPYLRFITEDAEFFRMYFRNSNIQSYKKDLRKLLRSSLASYFSAEKIRESSVELALDFYESGLFSLIRGWVLGGLKETPEEIDALIRICLHGELL